MMFVSRLLVSFLETWNVHFIPDVEVLAVLGGFEIDEGGEQEDHVAAFVHDGGSAVGAADLAGQLVDAGFLGALVPAEVVVAVGEVDVVLVEDGGPLEGGTWRAPVSVFCGLVIVGREEESRALPWIF